jgi:hypothetical protein
VKRREFLSALSATVATTCVTRSAFASSFLPPDVPTGSRAFVRTARRFPMIFVGESMETTEPIRGISTFVPWFGSSRALVNPALPKVRGKRLEFTAPGEYYLYVNGAPLKTVVFPRGEAIADAALRVFDFAVANNIYFGAHDNVWYGGRRDYLEAFFYTDQPTNLSCGPTHQMFRLLIGERLGLPARTTSANAAFFQGRTIGRIAHNIPEVYIPEAGKFAAVDLNAGYATKWLDGIELALATRKWGLVEQETERIEDLGVPIHSAVESSPISPAAFELLARLGGDGSSIKASRDFIASQPHDSRTRANGARAFFSGTGYWGKLAEWAQPTGTAYLDGHHQFVLLENEPKLRALVEGELVAMKTEFVDVDEMRHRLARGSQPLIDRCEWADRFVPDDERKTPLPPLDIGLP